MKRAFPITLELGYEDHIETNSVINSPLMSFPIVVKKINWASIKEGYVLVNIKGLRYDEETDRYLKEFKIKGRARV